jgi:hypothetical protein
MRRKMQSARPDTTSSDIVVPDGVVQTLYNTGRLGEHLGVGESMLDKLNDLLTDRELIAIVERSVARVSGWQTKTFGSIFEFRFFRIALYLMVRALRPQVAIETGVLHGMTSIFLLRALECNGCGRLIAVDLPSYAESGPANKDGYHAVLPPGKEPGWIVPRDRYSNFDIRLGASTEVLPDVTLQDGELGLFLHDSEHTFQTMWFELNWAWDRLARGGVLVCDNIEATSAYADFARRVERPSVVFASPDHRAIRLPRFGILVK